MSRVHTQFEYWLQLMPIDTIPNTIVQISPPGRFQHSPSGVTDLGNEDRIGNVERQLSLVMRTLTSMSTDMKSFQKAVTNMDVLVRSVHELQDHSVRSESRIYNTDTVSMLSSPPRSAGNQPVSSKRGSTGSRPGLTEKSSTSAECAESSVMTSDLRISRLVKAALDVNSTFRVRNVKLSQ